MEKCLKKIILSFVVCIASALAYAQGTAATFGVPFDFPLVLSGNFGELRSNHFHSGVDFKTQGVVGKPIRAVADGYICRASVQPGGYGNALYVMHDNGYMTVYGHLDRFPERIADRIRKHQYENETFNVNLLFDSCEYRVCRGEVFAYAGNSGYSFGPHLHFEVRDSSGNELYDPMRFYATRLRDTIPPKASSLAIYPREGRGAVEGSALSRTIPVEAGAVHDTIEAWGLVGFGVKALDYMNGTNNKYGVRNMELLADDVTLSVVPARHYRFIIILCAVGAYYDINNGGLTGSHIYVEDEYIRAAPGLTGFAKCGGNYAASLYAHEKAKKDGWPVELYLDAKEHKYVEEFSTSNFLGIKADGTYVTPDSCSVLPSVTNKSLKQCAEDLGWKVETRKIPYGEIREFTEVAACGTAVVVTPVWEITRGSDVITAGDRVVVVTRAKAIDGIADILL